MNTGIILYRVLFYTLRLLTLFSNEQVCQILYLLLRPYIYFLFYVKTRGFLFGNVPVLDLLNFIKRKLGPKLYMYRIYDHMCE